MWRGSSPFFFRYGKTRDCVELRRRRLSPGLLMANFVKLRRYLLFLSELFRSALPWHMISLISMPRGQRCLHVPHKIQLKICSLRLRDGRRLPETNPQRSKSLPRADIISVWISSYVGQTALQLPQRTHFSSSSRYLVCSIKQVIQAPTSVAIKVNRHEHIAERF